MNLSGINIEALSKEKKINVLHLAREFVQLEVLRRLSDSNLRRKLCFKGGTALHLVYNMDRYSEDLDFSLSETSDPKKILEDITDILSDEDIVDAEIKRKTVLFEIRQQFSPQNFRVKIEVNTEDIVPAELKVLYAEMVPASFNLQVMKTDYLVAQKIRALLQRGKGRDVYDLWFILRTKLPIDVSLVSKLTGIAQKDVLGQMEKTIDNLGDKQIALDLNQFVDISRRSWVKDSLRKDTLQLLKSWQAIDK